MSVPYYLRPKATHLEAGPDESLEPDVAPTDAERRSVPPNEWPATDTSRGPEGPPDGPLTGPAVDPARRMVPPSTWPTGRPRGIANRALRELSVPVPDLDPDIAMWPSTIVSRWPFTGPPAVGIWPLGWLGVDNTGTLYICTTAGQPGTWTALLPAPFVPANSNGSLVGPSPVPVNASLSTYLNSGILAAGTWLVNHSGTVSVAPTGRVELVANFGSATGAGLFGCAATEFVNPSTTTVLDASFNLSFLAPIVGPGTLVFQAIGALTGSNILSVTDVHSYSPATGYTAVRIA